MFELALIIKIITAIDVLLDLRRDNAFADVQAKIDDLVAQLNGKLPTKSDGTEWTPEDISALADTVRSAAGRIRDRTLPPA